ncbi:MAG: fatty acid CoA ligase family protein [Planctomycetota bacterium]
MASPATLEAPAVNVADRLAAVAAASPDAIAVAHPGGDTPAGNNSYRTCTFAELDRDATALARGLVDLGVTPQTRLALLVKPGVEFVKLVFALLRSGATTVMIDPGMGRQHLLRCLASVEPAGFVAISPAQAVRTVLRQRFPQAKLNVTVGRRWFWGGSTYGQLLRDGMNSSTPLPATAADAPAAIIFTSGSTGPPKGVLYTHRMFDQQAADIQHQYGLAAGGVDLSCFALFGLFNSAMGVTTVFPKMDFSRPASAECKNLLAAANDWRVTNAFASPAVWDKLSRHCERTGDSIPTLRRVFSCGAPVPAEVLHRTLQCVHPEAEMHTPYGATEALPVATIEAKKVLNGTAEKTTRGAGVCVGRKYDSAEWKVIRITDDPIADISEVEELPTGEIGELIVRAPQVSPNYLLAERANDLAKIADGNAVWHRMGDVGYFDDQEYFWYCGRKSQRVETKEGTLFTIPVEAVFNTHPRVKRSALVGTGPSEGKTPVLVVEPESSIRTTLVEELASLAEQHEHTRSINVFLIRKSLPVDVRHNSKINREQLAEWAAKELANDWPKTHPTRRLYSNHIAPGESPGAK